MIGMPNTIRANNSEMTLPGRAQSITETVDQVKRNKSPQLIPKSTDVVGLSDVLNRMAQVLEQYKQRNSALVIKVQEQEAEINRLNQLLKL